MAFPFSFATTFSAPRSLTSSTATAASLTPATSLADSEQWSPLQQHSAYADSTASAPGLNHTLDHPQLVLFHTHPLPYAASAWPSPLYSCTTSASTSQSRLTTPYLDNDPNHTYSDSLFSFPFQSYFCLSNWGPPAGVTRQSMLLGSTTLIDAYLAITIVLLRNGRWYLNYKLILVKSWILILIYIRNKL